MKIFITGGTGFIGKHTVERLAQTEHELHCLVRKTSDTQQLEELGATLVPGDVTDRDSLLEGMKSACIPRGALMIPMKSWPLKKNAWTGFWVIAIMAPASIFCNGKHRIHGGFTINPAFPMTVHSHILNCRVFAAAPAILILYSI